jgi:hypothetical protein
MADGSATLAEGTANDSGADRQIQNSTSIIFLAFLFGAPLRWKSRQLSRSLERLILIATQERLFHRFEDRRALLPDLHQGIKQAAIG